MSTILFFTWSGGGNQTPTIGLAQQLRRAGHQVRFAGYANQADRFRDLGLDFETLPRSGTIREEINPDNLMRMLVSHCWAARDHVADTMDTVARHQPELVVADCLMGGVLATLEKTGTPSATLVHSTPSALAPPGGPLDQFVVPAVNAIRADLDLPAIESFWSAWRAHDILAASLPELDPTGTDAFPASDWIGPVFEDADDSTLPEDRDDRPLILVSFSTGPAWDQTSRIQATIDGLAGNGVRVLVTAGAVDPARLRIPSTGVEVVPYLPHARILPRASAVVTHAGHGTLTAALAHGLPVVTIPNQAADQPALAARTAELGAGIAIVDEPTPARIADAVRTVLDDLRYATAARRLGDRIRDYRDRPVGDIESLLDTAAHRPVGAERR